MLKSTAIRVLNSDFKKYRLGWIEAIWMLSKLRHLRHFKTRSGTNVYDRVLDADHESDNTFHYDVILRVLHAIFAFLRLLEISLCSLRVR